MKNIILFFTLALTAFSSMSQGSKWHELEGYFRSPQNKEMVVQFIAGDTAIVAKLLWNGGEMHLLPDTGLAFVSQETDDGDHIHVLFQRDATGAVNQVNVARNGVWTRVVTYKPVTNQEMPHTPEQLQAFVGLYQYKDDSTQALKLMVDNNSLTIFQLWNGGKVEGFVPQNKTHFFEKGRPILTLDFSLDPDGQVTQFVAFGRDTWIRKNAQAINKAQFKSYEGKYQSKDDPDNEVRLIAADSAIIIKQLWDGKEIRVEPLTNSYFMNDQDQYTLHILTDQSGQVKSILLMNGRELFNKVGP